MTEEILDLSRQAGRILQNDALTVAVAESCTGGALGHAVTNTPGSSAYFKGGIVAYSNKIKKDLLNVSADSLKLHGAVSKSTALQMAQNVARLMNAEVGISTTGIAGPGGGSKQKPVGTVWIGLWFDDQHLAGRTCFNGSRLEIKQQTVETALRFTFNLLKDQPLPDHIEIHR